MAGWNDLPLEIRAKIMYSGYIIHPIVELVKDVSYIPYDSIVCDKLELKPSYIEHLCNIGILKYQIFPFYFF